LKIGADLDGTITSAGLYNPSIKLPWWLFYLLVPLVLSLKPDKLIIEKFETMKKWGYEIIIITARPKQLEKLTKEWLVSYRIPFDKLFCVGFGKGTKERKLKVIKEEKITIFIDDNKNCRNFLKSNSINVVGSVKQSN